MATITYTVTVASGTNQYGTGNNFYINGTVSPDLNLVEGNISLTKVDKSIAHLIVSEAMILMGYVTSLYLYKNN